jgi:hypothetical protein
MRETDFEQPKAASAVDVEVEVALFADVERSPGDEDDWVRESGRSGKEQDQKEQQHTTRHGGSSDEHAWMQMARRAGGQNELSRLHRRVEPVPCGLHFGPS